MSFAVFYRRLGVFAEWHLSPILEPSAADARRTADLIRSMDESLETDIRRQCERCAGRGHRDCRSCGGAGYVRLMEAAS